MRRGLRSASDPTRRAVLVCGIVAGVLAAESVAHAAFPGRNGRLAVSSAFDCEEGRHIVTMRPDGSGRRALTDTTCTDESPVSAAWPDRSSDGERILFLSENGITVVASDGSGQTRFPWRRLRPSSVTSPRFPLTAGISHTPASSCLRTTARLHLPGRDRRRRRSAASRRVEGTVVAERAPDRVRGPGEPVRRAPARGRHLDHRRRHGRAHPPHLAPTGRSSGLVARRPHAAVRPRLRLRRPV